MAQQTWIKFLKLKQNSLILKIEVTYNRYMNVQKGTKDKYIFGENTTFKQETHGPHFAHLRNQFKWAKLWLYHNIDLGEEKPIISFSRFEWFLFIKPWVPITQIGLKLAQWFFRRFLNFVNVFLRFHYYCISPWKRAWPFIWKSLNPLQLMMLCAKFGWNWSSGSGEEDENVKSLQTDR